MLTKEITNLLEEVFEYFGEEEKEEARKDPEVCLASLLMKIKEDLPDVASTLKWTVEKSTFFDYLDEARKKLNQKKKKTPKRVVAKSR